MDNNDTQVKNPAKIPDWKRKWFWALVALLAAATIWDWTLYKELTDEYGMTFGDIVTHRVEAPAVPTCGGISAIK